MDDGNSPLECDLDINLVTEFIEYDRKDSKQNDWYYSPNPNLKGSFSATSRLIKTANKCSSEIETPLIGALEP